MKSLIQQPHCFAELCHNVATESSLQAISAESFPNATANTADDACLDVKGRVFGVGVRMPNAFRYLSLSLTSANKHHEDAKKCEYDQHFS